MPSVHFQGSVITGNIKSSLYNHITWLPVQEYLESRGIIQPNSYSTKAWTVMSKARGSNHNCDLRILKFICHQLPTLHFLFRHKQVTSDKCPFCKSTTENSHHVFCCSHLAKVQQKILIMFSVAPTWQEPNNGKKNFKSLSCGCKFKPPHCIFVT